jgi:hypothetical protein
MVVHHQLVLEYFKVTIMIGMFYLTSFNQPIGNKGKLLLMVLLIQAWDKLQCDKYEGRLLKSNTLVILINW